VSERGEQSERVVTAELRRIREQGGVRPTTRL
jgi:hypothetical protein